MAAPSGLIYLFFPVTLFVLNHRISERRCFALDHPSLKKSIIFDLYSVLDTLKPEGSKIVLLTAAGVVTADPVNPDEINTEKPDGSLITAVKHLSDNYRKLYKQESPAPGNDGYIVLRNARLRSLGQDTSFDVLIVFFDQIIGVTIGGFSNE
jgi:hypothetical protein